jgi:hypothetical protein
LVGLRPLGFGSKLFWTWDGTGPKQAQETQTLKQGQKEKAPPLNRDDKNSNDPRVEEREREREVHEQNCTLDNTIGETSSVWTNLM